MSKYDFAEAVSFLKEAQITPRELRDEIEDAMSEIDPRTPLWHTLLTCADFLETITLK